MKKSAKITFCIKTIAINDLDSMLSLLGIGCKYKHHAGNIKNMFDGLQHFYRIGGATAIQLINQNKSRII